MLSRIHPVILTLLAMLAFAGNSLLCRYGLKETSIDAATFTSFRLLSGAVVLWVITRCQGTSLRGKGSLLSASCLFIYAAAFSFAYQQLTTATGALILFGSVQLTMISYGLIKGEQLLRRQWLGIILACAGLTGLLLPGLAAPKPTDFLLMAAAGIAWGVYSLKGKAFTAPIADTAWNFLMAVPLTLCLSVIFRSQFSLESTGLLLAITSGALTSGMGYAMWYAALPHLSATSAATVQLSVPVIATVGGALWVNEPVTQLMVITTVLILGGIYLVTRKKPATNSH